MRAERKIHPRAAEALKHSFKLGLALGLALFFITGCSSDGGALNPRRSESSSAAVSESSAANPPEPSSAPLSSAPSVSESTAQSSSADLPESTAAPESAPAEPVKEEPPEPDYIAFFNEEKVHELRLEIAADDWRAIKYNPYSKEYYHADAVIDGIACPDVGIHTRGVTSLNYAAEFVNGRLPLKLNFNKFTGGKFLGLDELALDNNICDASSLRQYTGMEVYRALGMNSPYVCFFNVYVNDELIGLYIGTESVDSGFLERSFGSHKHSLYKAGLYATLRTDMQMSAFEQKKGKDETMSDLKELIRVIDETPLGEKGDLEQVIDVDTALKYFAANAVMHNWDSYSGDEAHNYYLYKQGGKFYIIPWDLHTVLFQHEGGMRESPGSRQDVASPITGYASPEARPLVQKILAVDEYYERYLTYCEEALQWLRTFAEERLPQLRELIEESCRNDPTAFFSYYDFTFQFEEYNTFGIVGFIADRCAYLDERLPQIRAGRSGREQ